MMVILKTLLDGKWEDGTRPKDLYEQYVSKDPAAYIGQLIEGLGASRRKVQSGFAELASLLSEDAPALLYPHVGLFLGNLDAKARVLRWEAVCTLGNLAAVDEAGEIPVCLPVLFGLLKDPSIVLANHSVQALAKMAAAYPARAAEILELQRSPKWTHLRSRKVTHLKRQLSVSLSKSDNHSKHAPCFSS